MSEKTPRDTRDEVIRAAILADWQQVALNGGPPCFHVCEDGHFCFRAKRWAGHDEGQIHAFVSLEALLRAPETQERGWQDISTAPKDGTDVLLFWPMESERPVVGRWCARSKGHWYSDVSECQSEFTPTHWMPLPSPPAQTED